MILLLFLTIMIHVKLKPILCSFGDVLDGLRNRCKRVRTPVTLLSLLSDKYPWERYEPPYPPRYGLNSTTTVL